jgi:recombination protein RecA
MLDTKDIISQINKKYGKDTVITEQNMRDAFDGIECIPTGCLSLDKAIGPGGIPTKRITEYFGGESSGKTTFALQAISYCQLMNKTVVYIDAEHALDLPYASNLGVSVDDLIIIQPDNAESALNIIHGLLSDYPDTIGLIVLDSVAAMVPKIEADSESGDASVGLHARLLTSFVRKIIPVLAHSDAALLLINQQRATIGGSAGFGPPGKTTPGGFALKHGASVRVEFARTGNITYKEEVVGIKVVANVKKNKVGPPFRKANFEIAFGRGVDLVSQIIDYGIECGLVKKAGSWYKVGDETAGQGKESLAAFLSEKGFLPDMLKKVCDNLEIPEKAQKLYMQKLELMCN